MHGNVNVKSVFVVLCIVSTHVSLSVMESVVHRNAVIKYCMPILELNLFSIFVP